jgi:catechol 2,3-dioxygenase-like lactoylglutathione lyase family enzyme
MSTVQVRYIVDDVDAAMDFYVEHMGFSEVMHPSPNFAMLSRGDLRLALSAPGASTGGGGSTLPDGRVPEPGGWNRFAVQVDDVHEVVSRLRQAGVQLRSDVIEGVGGRQAIAEDPSGNPIELFEPKRPEARLQDNTA